MTHMPISRPVTAFMLSIVLVFLLTPGVSAQPPGSSEEVGIVVYLIEASNGAPGVDPEIKEIIKDLKGELRYVTYKLISKIPKKIKTGKSEKIKLPDSRELLLTAGGYEDGRVKLSVKVTEKQGRGASREVVNTDFRIVRGGTIIIGPYNYREGKLILAISANK